MWKKEKILLSTILFFIRSRRLDVLWDQPWRVGGRHPHSLSGAYLQDYASYGYEFSWVNRSHQGRVQCTRTITLPCFIFSSPEHKVLRVSYCDHSPSVGVRGRSVVSSHFLVYTLASTNINQSAPNLVQMYMTIRSPVSSIMEVICP